MIDPDKRRYYKHQYHIYGECVITSIAASIIFLSTNTRRMFLVEIFLSRDVAPLRAMCIVSSTSSICSSCFVGVLFVVC